MTELKAMNEHLVVDMAKEMPGLMAYQLALMQAPLISIRDEDDLQAVLLWVQAFLPGKPPMILAKIDKTGRFESLNRFVSLGWSSSWVELYRAEKFERVDPVATGKPWVPIVWSDVLHRDPKPKGGLKKFLKACYEHDMLHGVTFIADRDDHKIVISAQGIEVEQDKYAKLLCATLFKALADAATRVMSPRDNLYKLTGVQREIFKLMAWRGMTNREIATELGIATRTVRYHIDNMFTAYQAKNAAHLVALLLSM